MNALQIAATGMMAQQYSTEVVANNLANMNTSGFQRRRAEFADLIYSNHERAPKAGSRAGELVPGNVESGHGVRMGSIYRVSEQGSLTQTSNTFDIAIQGKGYFQVQLPNGELAYTRDGSFQLDGTGQLVTENGLYLQPGIIVPQDAVAVTINPSGEVLVTNDTNGETVNVGTLQLANFLNEGGLEAFGYNLFLATEASGGAIIDSPLSAGYGALTQGFLEASNVDPISEIAALIKAQRAYEMNSKVVQTCLLYTSPSPRD